MNLAQFLQAVYPTLFGGYKYGVLQAACRNFEQRCALYKLDPLQAIAWWIENYEGVTVNQLRSPRLVQKLKQQRQKLPLSKVAYYMSLYRNDAVTIQNTALSVDILLSTGMLSASVLLVYGRVVSKLLKSDWRVVVPERIFSEYNRLLDDLPSRSAVFFLAQHEPIELFTQQEVTA